jgi:tetratricopeptide (TPR) repeat protein
VLRETEASAPADTPERVWVDLGLVALQLGDPAAGERLFRRATAANANSAVGHEKLGLSLILQDRAGEAIPALERASALDPATATIRYNLAVALAREGRLTEAAAAARAALLLQPNYPQARSMLQELSGR